MLMWSAAGIFAGSESGASDASLQMVEVEAPGPLDESAAAPALDNLKAAFEATPPAPSYHFAASSNSTADSTSDRSFLPRLGDKVAMIQSGFAALKEAGNRLMIDERVVSVDKGDTLMDLLVRKAEVPRGEAHMAISALSKVYDPRHLRPDNEITVFFHQHPEIADPMFGGLRIEKDIINTVIVQRKEDGSFHVEQAEKPVHRSVKAYSGTIDSSLYVSAAAAGIPDSVIVSMIKMYSFNVDFQRDIQGGDAFEVMYEEYATEDGKIVTSRGNIVYARLNLGGRDYPFYRFEDSKGDVDYYDDQGRSARKTLMRTPIDGARLSSGFGMRKHPILGYNRMHKGVDFAAPPGTPIYAAGDGTIERIGPNGAYGNYIRIRHRGDLKTAYAHMRGFKRGLKAGSRVKQGEVIGYVGTTGRSTGPHLHYEVILAGEQVNPNSIKLPLGKTLKGQDLANFKQTVQRFDTKFARLNVSAPVVAKLKTDDQ